jgi:hypothetical protein
MGLTPSRSLLERRWILFLLIALLFRGLYMYLSIGELRQPDMKGRFAVEATDTGSYLDPIESMLAGGPYAPDYRMPGVGAPYWIFRQFLGVDASRDAMVILQWLLSGISVYLLAKLALRISGSEKVALATYALFLFSITTSSYDAILLSDSLAASVIIIQAYILQRAFDRRSSPLLLVAGLLLTWLYFIRPVAFPLVIFAALFVFLRWNGRPSLRPAIWLLLPVAFFETAWVVRNWKANHEFSPLTNQGVMPDAISKGTRGHAMDFVRGYGGNYIWWEPGADIRWFGEWWGGGSADDQGRRASSPPADAYVPGYNEDSLRAISAWIREIHEGRLSEQDSIAITARVNATLDRYGSMHADGAPFSHHVLSRMRMFRYMLNQSGCEMLFSTPFDQLPWWKQAFKLAQVAIYAFGIVAGGLFAVLSLWRWRRAGSLLSLWIPIVALYMICVYPLVLKLAEHRWVSHVSALWLMMGVLAAAEVIKRMWHGQGPTTEKTA